jgi:homoserine O-acetyltransferase
MQDERPSVGGNPSGMARDHRELWQDSPTKKLARVVHLDLSDPFTTRAGGHLPSIQVSYESWGELNPRRDNAVLIVHLLSTDPHVTGEFAGQPAGWWEAIVGPGRAIDTDRFFVVCPNLIGGCHGTTGPRFPAPDGAPYLDRFPLLAPVDMMRVQQRFVRQIGIERLHAVIGASMGGMVVWEWAVEAGDEVGLVAVVAAPLRTTAYQIGLNWLQRRGIALDAGGDEAMGRWGQMVARGVGMLSYRSPLGLEEKFGREWFKPPGSLLRDRGMFNVESWLRYHGKRSAQRFDPYTYVLFSRAMDLHDIGEGRDGIVSALDRVRCRVLVVGVSSDQLYPAADVHLGADILSNLGKPVEYAEIRSPHGHDAILLETEQLGAILRDAHLRPPRAVPSAAEREMRIARVGILGAGRVAALFLNLVNERRDWLLEEFGLRFEIAGVADIDPTKTLDPAFANVSVGYDPDQLVERGDIDAVLEVTRGTSALALLEKALRRRIPVVTTNKELVRHSGPHLEQLAVENGVRLAYHNAIAAGWPLLHAVERPLGREHVFSIQAVLSATCNIILERMEQGFAFSAALAEAQALGLTEPDPELDVSGWDTAQKLTMLIARAEGRRYLVEDLMVRGLGGVDPVLVREAPQLGLRVKLVGLFERSAPAPIAAVLPLAVPAESHLGGVRGDYNVVVIDGGQDAELVHLGRGAGGLPIAMAALNDLIGLFHPARSWTGRYPRALAPASAPMFAHFLVRQSGATLITDTPEDGGVSLLGSLIHRR